MQQSIREHKDMPQVSNPLNGSQSHININDFLQTKKINRTLPTKQLTKKNTSTKQELQEETKNQSKNMYKDNHQEEQCVLDFLLREKNPSLRASSGARNTQGMLPMQNKKFQVQIPTKSNKGEIRERIILQKVRNNIGQAQQAQRHLNSHVCWKLLGSSPFFDEQKTSRESQLWT